MTKVYFAENVGIHELLKPEILNKLELLTGQTVGLCLVQEL